MPRIRNILLMVCYMVLSSQVHSETQVVADGLAVELLESLDLTYQTIPDYDTENVLAGWNGDEFKYFVTFSKLPPGWLDADVWVAGFTRDINAASEGGSLRILDRGNFKSSGGHDLSYIEISFIPKGEKDEQYQLVHFITDHESSYLAFATPVSESGITKLRSEVCNILKTSHSPPPNITPLIRRNEDRYIGLWAGSYENDLKGAVEIIFELKKDLTFARKEVMEDENYTVYTGVWSVNGNTLNWTYLYGKPTSQGSKSTETDTIASFDGETLVLRSEDENTKIILQRAQ